MLWILITMAISNSRLAVSELVDMSHIYDGNSPYFPLHVPFKLQIMYKGYMDQEDGKAWVEFNKFTTAEHMGTHIDAPAHFADSPGKWRLHQIPIERFIGDAVVIDISARTDLDSNPDNKLLVSDITGWESKHGQIKDGSIVLMNSGWDQYWEDKVKYMGDAGNDSSLYHWPGISKEAAEWLVNNRKISGVGTDTMAFDSGDNLSNHWAHRTLLSQNIYGLENVKNLGKVPASGARVYVFPMNIKDGSGAPCRVIAEFGGDKEVQSGTNAIKSSLAVVILIFVSKMIV